MPKIPQYTREQLDNALEDINQGIPIRVAAKKYGIPRATLQFKLKNPDSKHEFGPNPYLTTDEEKHLEDWICEMGRRGLSKEDNQNNLEVEIEDETEIVSQEKESTLNENENFEPRDKEREIENTMTENQETRELDQNVPLGQVNEKTVDGSTLSENRIKRNTNLENAKTTIIITAEVHAQPTHIAKENTIVTEMHNRVKDFEQNDFD